MAYRVKHECVRRDRRAPERCFPGTVLEDLSSEEAQRLFRAGCLEELPEEAKKAPEEPERKKAAESARRTTERKAMKKAARPVKRATKKAAKPARKAAKKATKRSRR